MNRDFRELQEKAFIVLPYLKIIHGSRLLVKDMTVYSLKMFNRDLTDPMCLTNALKTLDNLYHCGLYKFLAIEDRDNDQKLSRYEFTNALDVSLRLSDLR